MNSTVAKSIRSSTGEGKSMERLISDSVGKSVSGVLVDALDEDAQSGSADSEASECTSLDNDVRRLNVTKSYLSVLDSDHGNKFERLTALASRIFRTPMAMVTISDQSTQYCLSSRGTDATTSIKSPFCAQAVSEDCDLMVVNDASKDIRFSGDPHVTGPPIIRFYAGAPLICPEGYRLGTLCVMDSAPRTAPVSLDEKQSLLELAAMAMDNLVELRTKKQFALRDPSQQIACTAHDLLTPLTGIALSLSLLKEDDGLKGKLTDQQRDMIETAANCSTVMSSICRKTMDFFKEQGRLTGTLLSPSSKQEHDTKSRRAYPSTVRTADVVKNLKMVIEPFPKQVPVIITVDPDVPPEFISDDMKIFRSASNLLTNACEKTESGSIRLRIRKTKNSENNEEELVFECEDTGPCVDEAKYALLFKPVHDEPNLLQPQGTMTMKGMSPGALENGDQDSGLGLYSVATQIGSLGGKYGFRPRGCGEGLEPSDDVKGTGSLFWFSIPLVPTSNMAPLEGLPEGQDGFERSNPLKLTRKRSINSISGSIERKTPDSRNSRSDQSLNKVNSEDAIMAYAHVPSVVSMKNEVFRVTLAENCVSEAPNRISQALVIEDSVVVRKNLARVLTKLGFEVTQAVNGMEGLKELKACLFDLVLCDFLMPVMDGLDCIQQYRRWEAVNRPFFKQYIIGISAHASDNDMKQGFKIGMNGFRSKPLTFKDIQEVKKSEEFKLVKVQLDQLTHEIEVLKERKAVPESEKKITALPGHKACLVIEGSTAISKLAGITAKTADWKIVPVLDPDSALTLLKMRNWDAVLVDDDLRSCRCISIFREWEKKHRINRQQNIMFLSASYASPGDCGTSFQIPAGFDGALAKPIQLSSLEAFFNEARNSWTIVTR